MATKKLVALVLVTTTAILTAGCAVIKGEGPSSPTAGVVLGEILLNDPNIEVVKLVVNRQMDGSRAIIMEVRLDLNGAGLASGESALVCVTYNNNPESTIPMTGSTCPLVTNGIAAIGIGASNGIVLVPNQNSFGDNITTVHVVLTRYWLDRFGLPTARDPVTLAIPQSLIIAREVFRLP